MREIKFRAWDKQGKKMLMPLSGILWGKPFVPTDYVQGLFGDEEIPDNYEYWFEGEMMAVNDCELMQFTGLHDKHGKEIYEGDILRMGYSDGSFHDQPSVVKFGLHHVGYDSGVMVAGPALGFYFSPYPYHGDEMGIGEHFNWEYPECFEVIGNIYEHPELLK